MGSWLRRYGNWMANMVWQSSRITYWLAKAAEYAENDLQKKYIGTLIQYYTTGDLALFDQYSIDWVKELEGEVDFVNGFIEVYGDPLGIKGSWESIVNFKDMEATKRATILSENAQWFEDHSPVDPRFKKEAVKGVSAKVINVAILCWRLLSSHAHRDQFAQC